MKLSTRLKQIQPSRTVAFSTLIQSLRQSGRRIIDFAVGEPAFEPPPAVIAATRQALAEGSTRYGPVAGLPALRAALAQSFAGCDADNVIVSNGTKQPLYLAFLAICDPGDEVIIPRPCWVSFAEQVTLAGARPVFVDTVDHQLDLSAIRAALSPRTRAVLVNSPNNPTGAVYSPESLDAVADLVIERGLILIADEAYHGIVYDGRQPQSVFDREALRQHVVILRSFSKAFAMTGFRVGYAVAPPSIISAMAVLQSHMSGNVCTFAQHGALAALVPGGGITGDQVREMQKKRDFAHEGVSRWFDCIMPGGAFYLFVDVGRHLGRFGSATDLAAHLLEAAGVAMVPGEAFGVDGHLRMSYAVSGDDLIEGIEKIGRVL